MSETVLKPCPFCGGKAEVIFLPEYKYKPYATTCVTGGCMAAIFPLRTPEEAEEKWNRRAEHCRSWSGPGQRC